VSLAAAVAASVHRARHAVPAGRGTAHACAGHAGGDDALRAIARILLSAVRGADLVVRWGGDELVAILPATGLEGARSFAERVRAAAGGYPDADAVDARRSPT